MLGLKGDCRRTMLAALLGLVVGVSLDLFHIPYGYHTRVLLVPVAAAF